MPILEFSVFGPQNWENETFKPINPERFERFLDFEALVEAFEIEVLEKPRCPCGGFGP